MWKLWNLEQLDSPVLLLRKKDSQSNRALAIPQSPWRPKDAKAFNKIVREGISVRGLLFFFASVSLKNQ